MALNPRLALTTVIATLVYLGLGVLGWGGLEGRVAHMRSPGQHWRASDFGIQSPQQKGMNVRTNRSDLPKWLLTAVLTLSAPLGAAEENTVTADEVVTAIEGVFGVTPGERRNHTKGTCALGEFVGTADAAAYSPGYSWVKAPIVPAIPALLNA
jgi:hypothetical protein